jgi:hypothetical protein
MTDSPSPSPDRAAADRIRRADAGFLAVLAVLGGCYVAALVALMTADVAYLATAGTAPPAPLPLLQPVWNAVHTLLGVFADPAIRHSFALTIVSCTITTLLSLVVAIPLGYLLSRHEFRGRQLVDAILDIPIVLPPLVLGISLLILFQFWPFRLVSDRVVFQVPAVVLAQFMVSAAFAGRIRPDRPASGTGRARARLHAGPGLPPRRPPAGRGPDRGRGHDRLGAGPGGVRAAAGLRGGDPDEDRGPLHDRVPGAVDRQPPGRGRRLGADGARRGARAGGDPHLGRRLGREVRAMSRNPKAGSC